MVVSTLKLTLTDSCRSDDAHMEFLKELDKDSCFDYFHEGVWELAIVENLSEFRTEIQINLPESKYCSTKLLLSNREEIARDV